MPVSSINCAEHSQVMLHADELDIQAGALSSLLHGFVLRMPPRQDALT